MLSQSQAGQSLKSNVKIWESGVLRFHTFHKRILFILSSPASTTNKKRVYTVNVPCLALTFSTCFFLLPSSFLAIILIFDIHLFSIYLYPASSVISVNLGCPSSLTIGCHFSTKKIRFTGPLW